MHIGDDGRLHVAIDEATLFGKVMMALMNGWPEDGQGLLHVQMDVTAEFWNETTREARSELIGRLVDALWLRAAEKRLMVVAVGRPRWGAVMVEMPETMLSVVTDRSSFPEGARRMTMSLRAYAIPPATVDLNI